MAMNFGKGNRSIAFNPTSAFPLDARSYFESYDAAVAAAATAEMAGSTNTQYYIGQRLIVVENNKVGFYIIQPNGTLEPIGKQIAINENIFEYVDNKLTLKGISAADAGTYPVLNADGSITWTKAIDSYSKSEVYTKDETNNKIIAEVAAAVHLKRKVIDSLGDINVDAIDAEQYIYMVPALEGLTNDVYDEYIVIDGSIERVGSWEVDLSDYAKTSDVNTALANKVDKDDNARLITKVEAAKLADIKDYIKNVNSTDFTVTEEGQLNLNNIDQSKVTGLNESLAGKVDAKENWTLLSPTDQAKLNALVIGDDNDIQISAKVNAENVEGLADWLNKNSSSTPGLSDNNLTNELLSKLNGVEAGAQKNYITEVDTNQLDVTNGKLSVKAIEISNVNDLQASLDNKASKDSVVDVVDLLNSYKTTTNARLDVIEGQLTWQSI